MTCIFKLSKKEQIEPSKNWGGGLTLHEIRKAKIVVIKVLCVFDKLSYKLVQALQKFFCNDAPNR